MIDVRREPTFDSAGDTPPRARPGAPGSGASGSVALVAVVVLVLAGLWVLRPRLNTGPPPVRDLPAVVDAVERAPAAPAPHHPLPPVEAPRLVPADGIAKAITGLVGTDAALRFLQLADFPRRAVATLDGLGREHAPAAAWPVMPTPQRFLVEDGAIAPGNAARYAPFVAFAGALDAPAVVDLYRRMYPVLQQAYRELGLGDRSLNDRVVEVLALLLATPEPAQPAQVSLMEVKGPIPSEQPWTRYEYADPDLQGLAAGQKILLRVGPEQRAVLRAKLRELQKELLRVAPAVPRP